MPRPPIDLSRKIKDLIQHVEPLADSAEAPYSHYAQTGADIWNSLNYIERALRQGSGYPAVASRHLGRLYGMAVVTLVETFERFLKEIAAACVDCLAEFIIDDRFNIFKIQGSSLASHFGTATLGKSLCESSTWLECDEINTRFRKLLADPFQTDGKFWLFPKTPADIWRLESLSLVWQIRHTAVHNVGVITQSDAVKLRLLSKEHVEAPRLLVPTQTDLRHLKRFIDETANLCNKRVGERLAELLTTIHGSTPTLFVSQTMADRVAAIFQLPLRIAGAVGVVPSD